MLLRVARNFLCSEYILNPEGCHSQLSYSEPSPSQASSWRTLRVRKPSGRSKKDPPVIWHKRQKIRENKRCEGCSKRQDQGTKFIDHYFWLSVWTVLL